MGGKLLERKVSPPDSRPFLKVFPGQGCSLCVVKGAHNEVQATFCRGHIIFFVRAFWMPDCFH